MKKLILGIALAATLGLSTAAHADPPYSQDYGDSPSSWYSVIDNFAMFLFDWMNMGMG